MTLTISTERVGARIYVTGNTYPIKAELKNAGCHWDGERKQWWIGSMPDWPLLRAWHAQVTETDLPRPWSTGGWMAYGDGRLGDTVGHRGQASVSRDRLSRRAGQSHAEPSVTVAASP